MKHHDFKVDNGSEMSFAMLKRRTLNADFSTLKLALAYLSIANKLS